MRYFQVRRECPGDNLRSTAYDRVASLLLATLTLGGTAVLLLLGLWVAPPKQDEFVIVYQPKLVDSIDEEETPFEFETPDPGELPGVALIQTPALFAASMGAAMASVDALQVEEVSLERGDPRVAESSIRAEVVCVASNESPPGPRAKLPRWERWEIHYATTSVDAYGKQLDHFGIELGAAGGGEKNVDYAQGFATASSKVREAPGSEDERLYMTWRDGPLKEFDRTLLQRAGIAVEGRVLLQFYPAKIEETLAKLEAERAGDRPVEQLRKTVFGLRTTTDGYEFFIKDQEYR